MIYCAIDENEKPLFWFLDFHRSLRYYHIYLYFRRLLQRQYKGKKESDNIYLTRILKILISYQHLSINSLLVQRREKWETFLFWAKPGKDLTPAEGNLIIPPARSGSSFLGSLMSAGDAVTYVYEPFFGVSINGTDIQNIINRNDVAASNLIKKNLTDLFDCRTTYDKRPATHKNTKNCPKNPTRVIKTIRVRYNQVKSWIGRSDIKVKVSYLSPDWFNPQCSVQLIHLLRDPRAMIRSRKVGQIGEKESQKVCADMERDLKLEDILPSDR